MGHSADFDVVVLGAGISGLLLASELAQKHRVLILEKQARMPHAKYWLTDAGSAAAHPYLVPAIDDSYSAIDFIAHDDTTFRCQGDYRLWDTERLLHLLHTRITERGGEIRFGQTFFSYRVDRDGAIVYANDERIRTRLIADCMGVGSPIIYAEDLIRIDGYYLLYGASFPRTGDLVPVAFHNLMLSNHPSYVEAFPTTDGRLHIILIAASSTMTAASSLKSDFTFLCTKSPYSRLIDSHASPDRRFLGGVVPVGRMRRHALDRIVFFGEAGQANPAASATALTRMLYSVAGIGAALSENLEKDKLDRCSLEQAMPPLIDQLNRSVQRSLFRQMLQWRSRHFRDVVSELSRMPDASFANAMIFATIRTRDIPLYARQLLQARATTLLRTLVAGAARIT